jgi:MFS family permease
MAGLAILAIHVSLALLTALLFLSSASSGLYGAAAGAVMTTLSAAVRGRTGGWVNAGNLGGGALGGGLLIGLADAASLQLLGLGVALLVALPAAAALLIEEAPRAREAFLPLVKNVARDLKEVFRSRRTWIGLIFFFSPAGSAAVANLISGVGPDYHASAREVLLISGIAGGLLSAFGSFAGGFLCDRMNRMAAYAMAGLLCAIFAVYLGFAPHTAWTYGAGYAGYAIAAGFSYAVFTALVLDVLGERKHAAGTGYAVMSASGNLPIVYMTALDGAGYGRWGVRGLMGVDAFAEAGAAVVLFAITRYFRHHWNPAVAQASTPQQ